jgi:HPt (histidine-containing phosphotransfer) domain-containing protein
MVRLLKDLFIQILSLVLCYQITFMPQLAWSQEDQDSNAGSNNAKVRNGNGLKVAADVMSTAVGLGTSFMGAFQQFNQQNNQGLVNQFKQTYGPKPFPHSVFPQCPDFDAVTNLPAEGHKCDGDGADPNQLIYYDALMQAADEIGNDYKLAATSGNNRNQAAAGLTCYQQQAQNLEAMLDNRIEKIRQEFKKMQDEAEKFKLKTRRLVDDIKEKEMLLKGKGAVKNAEIKFNAKKELRPFKNDPLCGKLASFHNQQGYNPEQAIEQQGLVGLQGQVATFSSQGEQLKINSVGRELKKMMGELRKGLQDNPDFDKSNISAMSEMHPQINAAFRAQAESLFQKKEVELNRYKEKAMATLDSSDRNQKIQGKLDALFDSNSKVNVDNAIFEIERVYKNECVAREMSDKGYPVEDLYGSKIRRRNDRMERQLFKSVDQSSYLDNFRNIVEHPQWSLEVKMQKIAQLNRGNNDAKNFVINGAVTIPGTNFNGSSNVNPTQVYLGFAEACLAEYQAVPNGQGKTIDRLFLKTLKRELRRFHKVAKSAPNDIYEELNSTLVRCDADPAVRGEKNSCSGDALNLSAANFCLNRTANCVDAARACNDRMDQFVAKIQEKQQKKAVAYKNEFDKTQNKMTNLYLGLKSIMQATSDQLDRDFPNINATFGTILTPDLKFGDMPGLADLPQADFKLEDPDALLDHMKSVMIDESNPNSIVAKLIAHKDKIMNGDPNSKLSDVLADGGVNGQVQKSLESYNNVLEDWLEIKGNCRSMKAQAMAMIREQREQYNKSMAQQAQACSQVNSLAKTGCPFGDEDGGNFRDIASAVGGDDSSQLANQLKNICPDVGAESRP